MGFSTLLGSGAAFHPFSLNMIPEFGLAICGFDFGNHNTANNPAIVYFRQAAGLSGGVSVRIFAGLARGDALCDENAGRVCLVHPRRLRTKM